MTRSKPLDGRFTRERLRTLAVERRGYRALLCLDAPLAALDEMEPRDERAETYR